MTLAMFIVAGEDTTRSKANESEVVVVNVWVAYVEMRGTQVLREEEKGDALEKCCGC
jgi:hypothetical protein